MLKRVAKSFCPWDSAAFPGQILLRSSPSRSLRSIDRIRRVNRRSRRTQPTSFSVL